MTTPTPSRSGPIRGGAGCSSSSGSPASSATASASGASVNLSSVTLHVGDQAGSGSQARLTAAGLISKLPFKVTWSDFTSGPPMLQAMGSGAIDIGSVGNAPPVFAAAGGEKVAIVGTTQSNPDGSAIVVPKNSFTVASRAALADPAKAAAIRDYLKLLDEAYLWTDTHQPAWAGAWGKATGLPDSVMRQAAKDDTATPAQISPAVVSSEQSVSNAFTTAGLIPGHVDFSDFVVTSFNDTLGSSG
jgi:ABC-type nitrate/sulfonate/bicarbonate transport system substrate-binding protein